MDRTSTAVNVFNKLASQYAERFMDVSLYAESLDILCERLSKSDAEILELACGPGKISRAILDRCPQVKLHGTDLAPKMLEIAGKMNPEAEFSIMDARHLKSLNKEFNCIVCAFGLPYLSKEESLQLISDAASMLRKDGLIYLSTMEDAYSSSGIQKGSTGDELYMYFHESQYLIEALERSGFENIATFRKKYIDSKGIPVTDLILIANP